MAIPWYNHKYIYHAHNLGETLLEDVSSYLLHSLFVRTSCHIRKVAREKMGRDRFTEVPNLEAFAIWRLIFDQE